MQKLKDTFALVNQDSLRDPTKKVSEIVKETIAAIGENIQVHSTGHTVNSAPPPPTHTHTLLLEVYEGCLVTWAAIVAVAYHVVPLVP